MLRHDNSFFPLVFEALLSKIRALKIMLFKASHSFLFGGDLEGASPCLLPKPAHTYFLSVVIMFARAAVRLLEEFYPVDLEAAVRAAIDKMQAGGEGEKGWHVDEMVRRKDEAEAAAEDSEDQGLVVSVCVYICMCKCLHV